MSSKADLLNAPATTPLIGKLLDHATIVENVDWQQTTDLFESFNCITTDRRANWPCPRTFLTPPVQSAGATATTGGTLPAGTYRFKVTALNAQGETLPSNEITVVTTGSTSTVTVNWGAVTNAVGYRIYGTSGAANSEVKLVDVGAVTTYTWTGSPALGTVTPPQFNTAETVLNKTFDFPGWPDGAKFAVYSGAQCKRFGTEAQRAEALAEVKRVFLERESFGVERGLIETVLQGATDLTPSGGAVSPKVGLAMLEADAATKYAGVPTIHTPRVIASLLAGDKVVEAQAGKLYSTLGSKIAAGGGYDASNLGPTGAAPSAGEVWMYGSGETLVLRGALIEHNELNRNTNDDLDLVERLYIVAVDCYKSAVRVKVA